MTWDEIKCSVNQWIWDNDERVYFWMLGTDDKAKTIRIRGSAGHENEVFYSPKRFFRDAKRR